MRQRLAHLARPPGVDRRRQLVGVAKCQDSDICHGQVLNNCEQTVWEHKDFVNYEPAVVAASQDMAVYEVVCCLCLSQPSAGHMSQRNHLDPLALGAQALRQLQ